MLITIIDSLMINEVTTALISVPISSSVAISFQIESEIVTDVDVPAFYAA